MHACRSTRWSLISTPCCGARGAYFRYGNSAEKFAHTDRYVNERLALLASAKHGLTGPNWVTKFNYEWVTSLRVHRLTGTTRSTTAYASR